MKIVVFENSCPEIGSFIRNTRKPVAFESCLSQDGEKSTLPLVCPEAGFSDDVNRIHRSGNSFLQGDFFNPGTVGILSWIILGWRWVAGGLSRASDNVEQHLGHPSPPAGC